MKTTTVRKLLPESWGFVCPVHTPDGGPCGLLNHLSASCRLLTHNCNVPQKELLSVLFNLGMTDPALAGTPTDIPVFLDGVLVGRVQATEAFAFTSRVRYMKVTKHHALYQYLEIFSVSDYDDGMWPSIVMATNSARFVRPVYYLPTTAVNKPLVEYIGPLEQLTMEIACLPQDFQPGLTTHQEISPMNILSVIASLTPFSDHNQSPRNMYRTSIFSPLVFHVYILYVILHLSSLPHRVPDG
jgi:DNA-directed RNA polymerase I subunit RPA2